MSQPQSSAGANRLMERQRLGGSGGDNCNLSEGPVPEREETCLVCGQAGVLVDDGWCKEAFAEQDAESGEDYLTGEGYLIEAEDVPGGWVCSTTCESQAMYQRLSEQGQKVMDAVADACRVLDEFGDRARGIVNGMTSGYVGEELVIQARELLHSVRGDGNDLPAWLNRPSREERLEGAINKACVTAEWIAKGLFEPAKAAEIADNLRKAVKP